MSVIVSAFMNNRTTDIARKHH